MANIHAPDFGDQREQEGFRSRSARLGDQSGSERLGLSLWELPPREAAYPFHYHHAAEELVIVLAGRPHLRTLEGWRQLEAGEVVSFRVGEAGAHQIANRSDEPVRFLSASTNGPPDIVVYPDSDKVGVGAQLPQGGRLRLLFRRGDAVDYWEGESPPDLGD